jgi:hypothetical protein
VAAGPPANTTGNNGDMYINSTTGDVYGPKASGAWGAIVANIKGATGAAGYSPQYIVAAGPPANTTGNNGDMYINSTTSDVYGPKTAGAWGAVVANIKGATGATGAQGPPGVGYTPQGAWSSTTTYAQGDQVSSGSTLYISLVSGNLNNPPSTSPTYWEPVAGMTDPTTTLGDLIVRGSASIQRLGVGANTQVLMADSTQTLGVKWGASTGVPAPPVGSVQFNNTGAFGGSANLTWDNTNIRLGIGISAPVQILHSKVASGDSIWRMDTSTKTCPILKLFDATGDVTLQSSGTSNAVYVTNGGNVGIGTTSPVRKLQVAAVAAGGGAAITGAAPNLSLSNADTDPNTNAMSTMFALATAAGNYSANAGDMLLFNLGSARGDIRIEANYSGGGANRNVILQSDGGNVGIGTTTPASLLHVATAAPAGSVYPMITLIATGSLTSGRLFGPVTSGGEQLFLSKNLYFDGTNWVSSSATGNAAVVAIGGDSGQFPIVFYVSPASANPRSLKASLQCDVSGNVVMTAGNVGIGTASPSQVLHVAGNCLVTGVYQGPAANNSAAAIATMENVGTAPAGQPNQSVSFEVNTTGNALFFYVRYSNGTQKFGSISIA